MNLKEQFREQIKEQQNHNENGTSSQRCYCKKCGAQTEKEALYCEECGAPLITNVCPNCGAKLLPGADLCENCGTYLNHNCCGFCGEEMSDNDAFCSNCGSSHAGIVCIVCGTLNHSSFCKKCYTPLNDLAHLEIQIAQKEPTYQQMKNISDEINTLEKELVMFETKSIAIQENVSTQEIEEEDQKNEKQIEREQKNQELKHFYENVIQESLIEHKQTQVSTFASEIKQPMQSLKQKTSNVQRLTKEEIIEKIKQKRLEVQTIIETMKPTDDSNPQMVRNYYMARKPPISDAVWQCVYKKFYHPNPSHCAHPYMGGKWVVVYEKINWQYDIE